VDVLCETLHQKPIHAAVAAVLTARRFAMALVPVPVPVVAATARRSEVVAIALMIVDRAQGATLRLPVALAALASGREGAASVVPGGMPLVALTIVSKAPVAATGRRQLGARAEFVTDAATHPETLHVAALQFLVSR